MFDEFQRKELLAIARKSIEHYLETGRKMDVVPPQEAFEIKAGAFVTLHLQGRLRGCIGGMEPGRPLYLTVRDMAVAAAFDDPRFPPLGADEFDSVDIEISVLSPMRRVIEAGEIEMGKHGVMVRRGGMSGVYLPQVATETGWNKEEFMNSLCAHKAGIPRDAWKTGLAEIYVFTSEVFGESEYGPGR